MSAGFPLQSGRWYFEIYETSRAVEIKIRHEDTVVVLERGSTKRIATERAWNALQDYCFGRSTKKKVERVYRCPDCREPWDRFFCSNCGRCRVPKGE